MRSLRSDCAHAQTDLSAGAFRVSVKVPFLLSSACMYLSNASSASNTSVTWNFLFGTVVFSFSSGTGEQKRWSNFFFLDVQTVLER